MHSLDFLARLHEVLTPPTYLEIGVRHGDSLTLARAPSIAIDPRMQPSRPVPAGAHLFEETSDSYFERESPLAPFEGRPASLAFIDGMHLSEYALRDFINVERHAHWTSLVVFDDILPRTIEQAARHSRAPGGGWSGDVFKILDVLSRHRPDLVLLPVRTKPSGLLLVVGPDPDSRVLSERYAEIERDLITPNPQPVPRRLLERRDLLEARDVLSASLWAFLRDARARGDERDVGMGALRATVRKDLRRFRRAGLRRSIASSLPRRVGRAR